MVNYVIKLRFLSFSVFLFWSVLIIIVLFFHFSLFILYPFFFEEDDILGDLRVRKFLFSDQESEEKEIEC